MKCPKSWEWGQALECLKEDCAWWDAGNSNCLFLTITKCLYHIDGFLMDIRDKMPHATQFVTKP